IVNEQDRLERWKEYIKELFDDDRTEVQIKNTSTGPNITLDELERAIKLSKNRKATGPDDNSKRNNQTARR
ncbi:unnamed protein product, partial [Diabrotica balteata]